MQPGPEPAPVAICAVTSSVSRSITATTLSPRSAAYAREPSGCTSTAFGARSNRVSSVRATASITTRLLPPPSEMSTRPPSGVNARRARVGQIQVESLRDRFRGDVDDGNATVAAGRRPDFPTVWRQIDPFRKLAANRKRCAHGKVDKTELFVGAHDSGQPFHAIRVTDPLTAHIDLVVRVTESWRVIARLGSTSPGPGSRIVREALARLSPIWLIACR